MSKTEDHNRCLVCNRPLKAHSSRTIGYGPKCYKNIKQYGRQLTIFDLLKEQEHGEL